MGSPTVAAGLDSYNLPTADTRFVGGLTALLYGLSSGVTTTLETVDVDVSIDIGGPAAGVATSAVGQVLLREVRNRGPIHTGTWAAGIVTDLAGGAAINVQGLASPRFEGVINEGDVLVSGTTAHDTRAAGIALGVSGGILDDVHNRGNVTNDHPIAGGAAGLVKNASGGTFSRVSSSGNISNRAAQTDSSGNPVGYSDVAGLVGYVGQSDSLTLTDCYSTGSLTAGVGENDIGGLIADIWDLDTGSIQVTNCYAANTFSGGSGGNGAAIGRINVHAGSTPAIAFTNVYWHTVTGSASITTGCSEDVGHAYCAPLGNTGLGTAAMSLEASFFGFDFANVWLAPVGGGYPLLR